MTTAVRRRRRSNDPPEYRTTAGTGGKYRVGSNKTEESTDKIAEYRGEDTEESVSEKEAATAMGEGEARRQPTATARGSEENGTDDKKVGTSAVGGNTRNATSAAADKAGAGGRHGARTAARERDASWWEKSASKPYGVGGGGGGCEIYVVAREPFGVGGDGGGRKAYRVAENPGGDRQGVGGEVESPQGINTPRVDAVHRGD